LPSDLKNARQFFAAMIELCLEAEEENGKVLKWSCKAALGEPLQGVVDRWAEACISKECKFFGGAGLQEPTSDDLLDLCCTPQQLEWKRQRTLWVIPMHELNNAERSTKAAEDASVEESARLEKAQTSAPSPKSAKAAVKAEAIKDASVEESARLDKTQTLAPSAKPCKPVVKAEATKASRETFEEGQDAQPPAKRAKTANKTDANKAARNAPASSGAVPAGDDPVEFLQDNPKRAGSDSHKRYEQYKSAKTPNEALQLGAVKGDIPNDFNKGFMKRRNA